MRAKRRNLKLAKQNFRQKLVKLHLTTRKRLVRTNISETYDQKRGNFLSNQRFNVDQSPMLFAIDMKRTYHLYEPAQDQNKKRCGFPIMVAGSKKVSAPCRHVFVLTDSNQGQVCFYTLTLYCPIISKKGTGIYIRLSTDISYYYKLITRECLQPWLQ